MSSLQTDNIVLPVDVRKVPTKVVNNRLAGALSKIGVKIADITVRIGRPPKRLPDEDDDDDDEAY